MTETLKLILLILINGSFIALYMFFEKSTYKLSVATNYVIGWFFTVIFYLALALGGIGALIAIVTVFFKDGSYVTVIPVVAFALINGFFGLRAHETTYDGDSDKVVRDWGVCPNCRKKISKYATKCPHCTTEI